MFSQNYVKSTQLLTVWVEMSATLWKNQKFTLTKKIFRQINYLVISIVNTLVSRNFCQNRVRVNFHNFHTVRTITRSRFLRQIKGLLVMNSPKMIAFCMQYFSILLDNGVSCFHGIFSSDRFVSFEKKNT